MTRDEIIRIARAIGLPPCAYDDYGNQIGKLETFAKLFAAEEREACAKVCDELVIHAKAKGDTDAMFAAISCATAIRIRGNNGQTS